MTLDIQKKQLTRHSAYCNVFKSPDGKKVLYDLFRAHSMLSTTYLKNDPVGMAILEGERNVIIRILSILKTNPKQLQKLIEEANDDN